MKKNVASVAAILASLLFVTIASGADVFFAQRGPDFPVEIPNSENGAVDYTYIFYGHTDGDTTCYMYWGYTWAIWTKTSEFGTVGATTVTDRGVAFKVTHSDVTQCNGNGSVQNFYGYQTKTFGTYTPGGDGGTFYNSLNTLPDCDTVTITQSGDGWSYEITLPAELPCSPYWNWCLWDAEYQCGQPLGFSHLLGIGGWCAYFKIVAHVNQGVSPPAFSSFGIPGPETQNIALATRTSDKNTGNQAPIVVVATPTNSATCPIDSLVGTADIPVEIFAHDIDGTIYQVKVYQGTNELGTATNSGGQLYAFLWNSVPLGTYTLTAEATDNGGSNSVSALVTIQVVRPAPVITSFSPTSGPVGTNVIISGRNFISNTSSNIVYFGAVQATVGAATATNLTVTVPTGATHAPLSVTVAGLTAISKKMFVPTFLPSSTNITFASKTNLITLTPQLSAACADLNRDGKSDIVTPNGAGTYVSVFTNGSISGTYPTRWDYSTGNVPYSSALADLNGDGLLDIIVGNCADQTISVYLNSANNPGTFAGAVYFAVAANPTRIAVGDLDGDGRLDLAVATGNGDGTNGVSVLRNTSSGGALSFENFLDVVTDPSDGSNPRDVAIADLDGDGKPDLVTSSYDSGKVFLIHNESYNGNILFGEATNFYVGTTLHMAIGDLDNDGKPELVIAAYLDDSLVILKNTSSPGLLSFDSPVTFGTASGPANVQIADINGDGYLDMVVCDAGAATVSVFRNTCTTTIDSNMFAAGSAFNPGIDASSVVVGDVDADGRPDLMVTEWSASPYGHISILKNTTAP